MSGPIWHSKLTVPVSPARDHIRGPVDALVTLVEYGDYQCPHCGTAHVTVKTIMGQVGDAVRFVFRHFPMTTVHPHAELAAEAAEAAGSQHRFWDMHDTLFANQQRLDGPALLAYASALGLDVDQFDSEVAGHVHLPRIGEDFMSGVRSGVNGTPTFFINGIRHDSGWDYGSLIAALQRAAVASAAA
ncbi:MAG TPA: DsbA family protein [Acidobacteriaceae bacterium]|jgi:protein-disulfide isomerase